MAKKKATSRKKTKSVMLRKPKAKTVRKAAKKKVGKVGRPRKALFPIAQPAPLATDTLAASVKSLASAIHALNKHVGNLNLATVELHGVIDALKTLTKSAASAGVVAATIEPTPAEQVIENVTKGTRPQLVNAKEF